MLLQSDCYNANVFWQDRVQALHAVVEKGDLRVAKETLDRRQLTTARDVSGLPLLHKAVIYEHTDIMRYMLQHFPECLDLTDHVSGLGGQWSL